MAAFKTKTEFESKNFHFVLDVSFPLESFREYITTTQKIIEKEIKNEILTIEKFLKENPEQEEYYDYGDHQIKIHTYQLYYTSIFITLYSFLEKKLFQICKLAESKKPLKINDISGDGVYKYQKYLKKVVGIDFSGLNKEWDLITRYNKLRNQFVHNSMNAIEKTDANLSLIKLLSSIDGLTIVDKNSHIEFHIEDKKLIENFIQTIDRFLSEIYYEEDLF